MVCEVQCAMPDVHCAVDLNCGYNAILQKHLRTRILYANPQSHCHCHCHWPTASYTCDLKLHKRTPRSCHRQRTPGACTPCHQTPPVDTEKQHQNKPIDQPRCVPRHFTPQQTQSRCLSHMRPETCTHIPCTCHKQRKPGACTLYYQIHLDGEGCNTRS